MTGDFQFLLEPQESPDMDVDFVDQVHLIAIEQKPDDPYQERSCADYAFCLRNFPVDFVKP